MRSELEAIFARHQEGPLEAFAQVHLATAAERATYRRFVSDPGACWSDAEIAFAGRLDISEVRWALGRFADAGIVDEVEDGCYRWRLELRYVLECHEPQTDMRDPVCGMPVAVDAPHRAEDVFERTERFCSERCLASFLVWPLVFTRPPDAGVDRPSREHDDGP